MYVTLLTEIFLSKFSKSYVNVLIVLFLEEDQEDSENLYSWTGAQLQGIDMLNLKLTVTKCPVLTWLPTSEIPTCTAVISQGFIQY